MGNAIPSQHPAVVLRSHYNHLRALLAVALVAVVGLTAAVVIVSTNDEVGTSGGAASELTPQEKRWAAYDEAVSALTPEQLAAAFGAAVVTSGTRYDGGPEEGSADVAPDQPRPTEQQAYPGLADKARGLNRP
jgi:hypothetical protein